MRGDPQIGVPANVGLLTAKPVSYLDVPPEMQWDAVDKADPSAPLGSRGIGEPLEGCAAAALFHLSRLWRQSSRLAQTGLLFAAVLAILSAVFARVNIYERMFHPNLSPHFVASAQAGIDDADMVMSVRLNGEARAYPIREMGYHHIVDDVVGGAPIVATY